MFWYRILPNTIPNRRIFPVLSLRVAQSLHNSGKINVSELPFREYSQVSFASPCFNYPRVELWFQDWESTVWMYSNHNFYLWWARITGKDYSVRKKKRPSAGDSPTSFENHIAVLILVNDIRHLIVVESPVFCELERSRPKRISVPILTEKLVLANCFEFQTSAPSKKHGQ